MDAGLFPPMLRHLAGPGPGIVLAPGALPPLDVKKEVYYAIANAASDASDDQVRLRPGFLQRLAYSCVLLCFLLSNSTPSV